MNWEENFRRLGVEFEDRELIRAFMISDHDLRYHAPLLARLNRQLKSAWVVWDAILQEYRLYRIIND